MKKANGEGSIWTEERNGKIYYRGAITIGLDIYGKAIRKNVGSYKKSVVIDKLNALRYKIKKTQITNNPNITFGSVFYSWIYDYKKNEVQNNTFAEYEVCYRLRIVPHGIANMKMNMISLDTLQRYFNDLQKQGWSKNVIKKTYIKINSCFTFAEIHGIVEKNYCKGVIIGKVQKKKDDQYKVFTKEEQEAIIKALDLRNVLDKVIYFTFYTGLRLGEVLAIKWENIQDDILSVKEQYQREVVITKEGSRKTTYIVKDMLKTPHSQREIPLPQKIKELLNDTLKLGEFVFCDTDGNLLEVKRVPRRFKKLCESLGLGKERSFHSIRHTYATRLFEMNIPVKMVQSLLGHSDIQTTLNIYTHVTREKKLEILDKLDSI